MQVRKAGGGISLNQKVSPEGTGSGVKPGVGLVGTGRSSRGDQIRGQPQSAAAVVK